MEKNYIPKRTELYGDFEFSKFIDDDTIYDTYINDLLSLSELAHESGHHEISDLLDAVSFSIQTGRYRELHKSIEPTLYTLQNKEFASQN